MPKIQPGQVASNQSSAPKLYGIDKQENTIPFQEKLSRLFKPQEFVNIQNILSETVYWQYMPKDNENESFSEDGVQKQITRSDPEMWEIGPGEIEPLVGECAYLALDVMYKNYMANTTLKRYSDPTSPQFDEKNQHMPKNFNFADGGAQDAFIAKAYLGKATPNFRSFESNNVEEKLEKPAYTQPDIADKSKELSNVGKK